MTNRIRILQDKPEKINFVKIFHLISQENEAPTIGILVAFYNQVILISANWYLKKVCIYSAESSTIH